MGISTMHNQFVPSGLTVRAPWGGAFEHQASVEVVIMPLEIYGLFNRLAGASFHVASVTNLLGFLVLDYDANILPGWAG